jgi:outer membrane protein assembly factor BamD
MVGLRFVPLSVLAVVVAGLIGCSSGEAVKPMTVEERFAHAKALFDDRSYLEAINEFTVITLQFQGSAVAADAQYYLGESRFQRGEYLLAAFEYQNVKRNFPASPRVADAQFKLALSYYNLAPKSVLDQQYTRKSIDEFQSFVEYYPGHEMAPDADAKIKELTTRLAKKQYDTARLYAAMEYFKSALFYFDDVIEKYHDTEYAPLAYIEKVELLMKRNRHREAGTEIMKFLDRYPHHVLRGRGEDLRRQVEEELGEPLPGAQQQADTSRQGT